MNIILIIYSLLCMGLIIFFYKGRSRNNNYTTIETEIEEIQNKNEKIKMLIELEKLTVEKTPWYEKSISAIGTIVFFGMLAATTIQTIQSIEAKANVFKLKEEIEKVKQDEYEIQKYILETGKFVIDDYDRRGNLTARGSLLLEKYTNVLEGKKEKKSDEIQTLFWAYMLLQKYDLAIKIVEKGIITQNDIKAPDMLTLSEYYTIKSDFSSAKNLMINVKSVFNDLSKSQKIRFYSLEVALGIKTEDETIISIAGEFNITKEESRRRLAIHIQRIKNAREKKISLGV